MDRARILRGLRIVATVVCLVVCGLLIVLWVRSYWWRDVVEWRGGRSIGIVSLDAHLELAIYASPWNRAEANGRRSSSYYERWGDSITQLLNARRLNFGFDCRHNQSQTYFATPHWFPVLLSATLAALPWIKWRFSLRTMLTGMTLVAVVCGAIAMM